MNNNRHDFWQEVDKLHDKYFPHFRCGQLMSNFTAWLAAEKGSDIFALEDGTLLRLIREYAVTTRYYNVYPDALLLTGYMYYPVDTDDVETAREFFLTKCQTIGVTAEVINDYELRSEDWMATGHELYVNGFFYFASSGTTDEHLLEDKFRDACEKAGIDVDNVEVYHNRRHKRFHNEAPVYIPVRRKQDSPVKYTYGDVVLFHGRNNMPTEGVVEIVDANGTFERPGVPSYDIFVKAENMLYKHIPQKQVIQKLRVAEDSERLAALYADAEGGTV